MDMTLNYDASIDGWTLITIAALRSSADVIEWENELRARLAKIEKPIYLLVEMDRFEVHPTVAQEYGRVAKGVADDFAEAIVRYGTPPGSTKTSVRLEGIIQQFRSNIFADRSEAIAHLQSLRGKS